MCLSCYNTCSVEDRKQYLNELVNLSDNDKFAKFERYNTSRVLYFLYNCLGLYGDECKQLGLKAARAFISWLATEPLYYLPENGYELLYHPDLLTKVVDWCERYRVEENEQTEEAVEKGEDEKKNEKMPVEQQRVHLLRMCKAWHEAHQDMLESSCWYRWRVVFTHWLVNSNIGCDWYYNGRPVWFRPAPSAREIEEAEAEEEGKKRKEE